VVFAYGFINIYAISFFIMEKLLGIFDKRIKIWFHYVLLVGALFGGFYLGESFFNLSKLNTFQMFIFWYIILSVSDQLIHYLIGVD
jgi:hypothetical protein